MSGGRSATIPFIKPSIYYKPLGVLENGFRVVKYLPTSVNSIVAKSELRIPRIIQNKHQTFVNMTYIGKMKRLTVTGRSKRLVGVCRQVDIQALASIYPPIYAS
jgi:hypothetical protein